MLGSKIIYNTYYRTKEKINLFYLRIKNIPSWYKNKILELKNYYYDCKYKFKNLKDTNYELGVNHLYRGNLNDALFRFKLVDKFLTSQEPKIYYQLAWTYFLKNNYSKALEYITKSTDENKIEFENFLQNYKNINEIPEAIWQKYRDLTASYYTNNFHNNNNINLPYNFIHQTLDKIATLPNNYAILELGSNVGLAGYEIQKRFPEKFNITAIESSVIMNDMLSLYYPNLKIYDQVFNLSIAEFVNLTSNKFDVILSFCALSFTKELKTYFNSIYDLLNDSGYFAFCLPIATTTNFSLKRKEFLFDLNEILEAINTTKLILLDYSKLTLAENNKYCIVICQKITS